MIGYWRFCTARTDLEEFARQGYRGRQYRDEKTGNLYKFFGFVKNS